MIVVDTNHTMEPISALTGHKRQSNVLRCATRTWSVSEIVPLGICRRWWDAVQTHPWALPVWPDSRESVEVVEVGACRAKQHPTPRTKNTLLYELLVLDATGDQQQSKTIRRTGLTSLQLIHQTLATPRIPPRNGSSRLAACSRLLQRAEETKDIGRHRH